MSSSEPPSQQEPTQAPSEKLFTLKSSDNQEFVVKRSVAIQSMTIKNCVEEDDGKSTTIPLLNVDGKTLAMILEYLNKHHGDRVSDSDDDDLTKFDAEFVNNAGDAILDILMAAHYLDIIGLVDLSAQVIADEIKDKSVEYVRRKFDIINDFTEEEERAIRQENAWVFEDNDDD